MCVCVCVFFDTMTQFSKIH